MQSLQSNLHRLGLKVATLIVLSSVAGCAIFATRPVQEMADAAAAVKAAREVQADVLAPELFQQATENFAKAKREYRYKNFSLAKEYIEKARKLAEQAEYNAMRSGATRSGLEGEVDPYSDSPTGNAPLNESHKGSPKPPAAPYDYPKSEPRLATSIEDEPAPSPSAAPSRRPSP